MPNYSMYLDRYNMPPTYSDENWIISRSIDDAIEMLRHNMPDRMVYGNCDFASELQEWIIENGVEVPAEYLMVGFEPTGNLRPAG